jgi:acyl-CoA thioester hydrolase
MDIPEIDIYVRFCETDAAGHVNNISYFIYIEEARTKFIQAIGFGREERENLDFIIATAQCDFVAQAYAYQTLKVATNVSRMGEKSFTLQHTIKAADTGVIVATGSAVIVCYNFQNQQSVTIPLQLRSALEQYLVPV